GYVDVTTTARLFFASIDQDFPDSGQLLISASTRSHIRVTAVSATQSRIEVDANGDGVYENTASVRWADLTAAVGAAARDKDGDGVSNLAEYLAGTDPTSAASKPASVNLSVSGFATPDPAQANTNVTYTIRVNNLSANAAANVVLTDNLPAGVNFVS